MFVAAIALGLALLVSFLFTRYFAYRNVQENFYGQALVPARQAFDFHLMDQDGKAVSPEPDARESRALLFRIYSLPECLPDDFERSGKGLSGAACLKIAQKVQVLFVSIDPQRDKPETMKNYVPYFNDSFIGLTGTEAQLTEAAKAYGAYLRDRPRSGSKSGGLHRESFGADLLDQLRTGNGNCSTTSINSVTRRKWYRTSNRFSAERSPAARVPSRKRSATPPDATPAPLFAFAALPERSL